jgi:translocation and assembly module TamA
LRSVLLFLILALLAALPVRAANFIVELDAPDELRAVLEKHLQIFGEIADPSLTEPRFRFLVRRAEEEARSILNTEGYFAPQVTVRIEPRPEGLTASIRVQPGEAARIASIDLQFRGALSEPGEQNEQRIKTLRRSFSLNNGEIFRNEDWDKAKEGLLQGLTRDTFPAAQIADSEALVDPETRRVDLRLVVDSGPVFTFGEPEIEGLESLPPSLVLSFNRITPGSVYRERDLSDLQNALQRTNYFRSVFVTTSKDPAHPERVPIRVSVTENTARKIGIGIGYSTDTGAGGELRYEDNLTFRPGWRSRSALKLDQREQSLTTELFLIPIRGALQPKLDAQVKQTKIQNDTTVATILGTRLLRTGFDSEWALSLELRTEHKETSGVSVGDSLSLPINLSWTRRVLDDPIYPRKGFVANLQGGGAAEAVLSDRSFLRLYGKANAYWPVGARGTLILRGELGAVDATSRDGIPDDYLFRAGGSQSVRGYSYGELGVAQNGAIVPGRYLGVASVELTHPIADEWAVAIFYDAGNAVDSWHDFHAVQGYGAGLRWRSPLGPLNLDVAYGDATQSYHLHFSVGMTF